MTSEFRVTQGAVFATKIKLRRTALMLSDHNDASLVSFALNGDRNAFSVLFQRHQGILRSVCRRTLSDSTLADDVVQEAALQAMLNLDRLQNQDRFGPWL